MAAKLISLARVAMHVKFNKHILMLLFVNNYFTMIYIFCDQYYIMYLSKKQLYEITVCKATF